MKLQNIFLSIVFGVLFAYPIVCHQNQIASSHLASPIAVDVSSEADQRSVGQVAPLLSSAAIGPKKGDADQGLQGRAQSIESIIGDGEIKTK